MPRAPVRIHEWGRAPADARPSGLSACCHWAPWVGELFSPASSLSQSSAKKKLKRNSINLSPNTDAVQELWLRPAFAAVVAAGRHSGGCVARAVLMALQLVRWDRNGNVVMRNGKRRLSKRPFPTAHLLPDFLLHAGRAQLLRSARSSPGRSDGRSAVHAGHTPALRVQARRGWCGGR
jgi:hypothetical protein